MKKIGLITIVIFLLLPLWSYLAWVLWPKEAAEVLVFSSETNTENAVSWVLKHEGAYSANIVLDGESALEGGVDSMLLKVNHVLANVAWNPVYEDTVLRSQSENIISSLNEVLAAARNYDKTIFIEATPWVFASEADKALVNQFWQVNTSAWVGKYFEDLNMVPDWVKELYMEVNHIGFDYRDAGLLFVHANGNVVVLEKGTYLLGDAPIVETSQACQEFLKLPAYTYYPKWFVVSEENEGSDVLATIDLATNAKGDSLIAFLGIPKKFPALLKNDRAYYFAGDFSSYQTSSFWASFKGFPFFARMFNNASKKLSSKAFFWSFYHPLLKNGLKLNDAAEAYSVDVQAEDTVITENISLEGDSLFDREKGEGVLYNGYRNVSFMNAHKWAAIINNIAEKKSVQYADNSNGERKWRIVIASLASQEKAVRYAGQLQDDEVSVLAVDYLQTYRITIGSYVSLRDCQQRFNQVVGKYPEAWMVLY